MPDTSRPQPFDDERTESPDISSEGIVSSDSDTEVGPRSTATAEEQTNRPSSDWLNFMTGDDSLNEFPEDLFQQLVEYCKQEETTDLDWAMKPGPDYTRPRFRRWQGRKAKFVISGTGEELDAALYGYHTEVPGNLRRIIIVQQKSQNLDVSFNDDSPAIIVRSKRRGTRRNDKGEATAYWSIWNPIGPLIEGAVQCVVESEAGGKEDSCMSQETSRSGKLASCGLVIKTEEDTTRKTPRSQTDSQMELESHTKLSLNNKPYDRAPSSLEPGCEPNETNEKAARLALTVNLVETILARKAEEQLESDSARQKRVRITRSHTNVLPTMLDPARPLIISSIEEPRLFIPGSVPPTATSSQGATSPPPFRQPVSAGGTRPSYTTPTNPKPSISPETPTKTSPVSKMIKAPTVLSNPKRASQILPLAMGAPAKKVIFKFMKNRNDPRPRIRGLTDCSTAQKLFAQARCAGIASKDTLVLQIQVDQQDLRIIMCEDRQDYQDIMNEIQGLISEKDKEEEVEVIVMPED